MTRTTLQIALLAATLFTSSPASAETVRFVDDDGGPLAGFTSLQAALNASSAGDRIELFAGVYGPATVTRGVTIMGLEPGVVVEGLSFRQVGDSEIAVLADIERLGTQNTGSTSRPCRILDCAGTVLLDRVGLDDVLEIARCTDVRLSEVGLAAGFPRLEIEDSFAQVVQSVIRAGDSQDGIRVRRSELVVAHSSVRGASETTSDPIGIGMCITYDGHQGLSLSEGSIATVLRSSVNGGTGSPACFGPGAGGSPGRGILVDASSTLRRAQVTSTIGGVAVAPGALSIVVDDLPSLALTGGRAPGETAEFETRAGAGTSARLWAGRFPRRIPFGPWIPFLHSAERGVSLGAMPPSQLSRVSFPLPALARGTLVHGQAMRTRADGTTDLSNSVTLLVR
ncbi:MAG: hypothetical protein AAFU73_20770 [Planctomycetota bacterium]